MELTVNGRLFKRLEGRRVFLFEDVPLADGDNVIRAVSGSCADEMTITRVDEPEKSYIYIDPTPPSSRTELPKSNIFHTKLPHI